MAIRWWIWCNAVWYFFRWGWRVKWVRVRRRPPRRTRLVSIPWRRRWTANRRRIRCLRRETMSVKCPPNRANGRDLGPLHCDCDALPPLHAALLLLGPLQACRMERKKKARLESGLCRIDSFDFSPLPPWCIDTRQYSTRSGVTHCLRKHCDSSSMDRSCLKSWIILWVKNRAVYQSNSDETRKCQPKREWVGSWNSCPFTATSISTCAAPHWLE